MSCTDGENAPLEYLSQTSQGQKWLNAFDIEDRAAATLLLDSLTYFDASDFQSGIMGILRDITASSKDFPVAFLPVFRIPRKFIEGSGKEWSGEVEPSHGFLKGVSCRAQNFQNESCRSGEVIPQPEPGSEYLLVDLIRKMQDARRRKGEIGRRDPRFLSLPEMKEKKIRKLILVTDVAASGKEVKDYLSFLLTNRTLQSWISYRLISLTLVVFSLSEQAKRMIEDSFPRVEICSFRRTSSFSTAMWTQRERKRVRELCIKYSPWMPLGYGEAELLEVLQHSTGNGLPGVIFSGVKSVDGTLTMLFEDYRMPFSGAVKEVAKRQRDRIEREFEKEALSVLSLPDEFKVKKDLLRSFLSSKEASVSILSCLRSGLGSVQEISERLSKSQGYVYASLSVMKELGYVVCFSEETYKITDFGNVVFSRLSEFEFPDFEVNWEGTLGFSSPWRLYDETVAVSSWNYYPRSLR